MNEELDSPNSATVKLVPGKTIQNLACSWNISSSIVLLELEGAERNALTPFKALAANDARPRIRR